MDQTTQRRQARDRGVTRSKAEKARPPTQPVPQVDIVPGRLNEAEWIAFMSLEEGEDIVGDILADLVTRVMECAFKVYLTQQEPGNPDQFLIDSSWLGRESQEPTQSSEPSAEPRVNPRPTPAMEVFEEAEPRDALEVPHRQESILTVPSKESLRPTLEVQTVHSPQLSPKLSQVVSLQTCERTGSSFGSHLSLQDLYHCVPQPDAAGDRLNLKNKGQLCRSSIGSADRSLLSVPTPDGPSPFLQPGGMERRPSHKTPTMRLDPSRLPRHWVRPVAEVLIPDLEARPLEIYRVRPRKSQVGASASESQALGSRTHSKLQVSIPRFPLKRCATFRSSGPDPTLNLAQSSPSFGSNLPFLSPGFRFLARNLVPPDVASAPSPKLWPRAKWPSGWEREAEQLGELWAGRTRVPPQGQEPVEDSVSEDSGWPLAVPQVLEATSQVLWKPMVISENMKLVPGVSMWNRGTQELLNPAAIQEEAEEGTPQAPEQQPIQTGVSKPQVIMKQLRNETPKAWLLPTKPVPHSGS
ncbi:uncharacterized protein C2orf81 homolog isoform X2 [Rattus norvegicus]|uniref:uncharacterized protein C2orf81 homolog isoform X2 n=1 Tax=Rattus norvegicus TaxID=10116 RepID=UPI0003D0DDFD|nr:uncharacterized protein C2orf81 homolog isoform X2 [Rattus norvegicus]